MSEMPMRDTPRVQCSGIATPHAYAWSVCEVLGCNNGRTTLRQ